MLKKWLSIAFKITVSVGLIWSLLADDKMDIAKAWNSVLEASPLMIILALAVFIFQIGLANMRWLAALAAIGSPLSFINSIRIYYIGIFFNQTLPSSVGGDAIRIYKAYRSGLTMSAAINGVFLERVATVLALVIVMAATQPIIQSRIEPGQSAWILPTIAILAAGGVGGLGLLMVLDRLPRSLSHWRLVRGLAVMAADTRRAFLSPRKTAAMLGWSLLGHINVSFGVFLLAVSLGINVTLVDCMALIPPVLLITTIPISIAGWGVREKAMVVAFGLIGVPGEEALVLSLLFGFVTLAVSLPGGAIWLATRDAKETAALKNEAPSTSSNGSPSA